jgi:hypothetical protein
MPLINFRTNLTSLKFGMDRPGGGDSGQPFEQFPIDGPDASPTAKTAYELNRTSIDFPIRGGAISSLVNGTYTTNAAIIDLDRIKKFFKSTPQGTAFIQKQKDLQLTNPKTQVPNSLQFAGISLMNSVIPVTQVYNPANTLAQVGASGTGAHFNRHGVGPTIYESVKTTYQFVAGAPENNTETTNRLSILRALKLVGNTDFLISSSTSTGLGLDPILVDRLGISPIQNQIFNYPGGPGSNYGIGFTRIFRYTNTDATNLFYNDTKGFTVGGDSIPKGVTKPYSTIALTYAQLAEQNTRTTNPQAPTQAKIQDFRQLTNGKNPIIPSTNYSVRNIANYNNNNIGIGNPGAPLRSTNYRNTKPEGIDRVNNKNLFYFNPNTSDPWKAGGKNSTKDIIKFAFECLSNDDDSQAIGIVFRAFLEGQISDSNTAEYNSFKYLGRGETFRTYQGFNRTISFTFKIFAQTRVEMKPLYRKLNNLISQVYPDYSPTSNLMRGNVVRLTIGDYLYRMSGFLQNVNVSIDNSNTPWEIVLNSDETDMAQLPHMVTVQCTFLPIMDILPRRESFTPSNYSPYVPLIANTGFLSGSLDAPKGDITYEAVRTTAAGTIPAYTPPQAGIIDRQLTGTPAI